jgi:Flp pilus assembly protein TadG
MRRFLRSRRGNVGALVAILILPLAAMLGMATEGGSWFLITRAMQNAADSAVIAAATNGGNNAGADYVNEGKAIASSYGFVNGTSHATVAVAAPATYATVASCVASNCYRVNITKTVPLYLMELIGFRGNTTVGTVGAQQLSAVALATVKDVKQPFCLLALGSSGASIQTNGSPAANLGCNVQSNGDSNCNGHSITTGYSNSGPGGTQTGSADCGVSSNDGQPALSDPYATTTMSNNITTAIANAGTGNHCTGSPNNFYPEGNSNRPAANTFGANMTLPAVSVYCGDINLTGDVVLTSASPGSVIIIQNGMLNLNGHLLQSASGSGVALIFYSPQGAAEAYTSGGTPTNFICIRAGCANGGSGGVLDISSPTSGTFSGIAVLQDKDLPLQGPTGCPGNDKWGYAGSSPTWKISGVADFDRTNLCISGGIQQATYGNDCLTLVDNMTIINGTGNLLYTNPQSQCPQQGVSQILAKAYVIGQLVY